LRRLRRTRYSLLSPSMSYQRGDHACVIYSTREELAAVVTAFIREGLSRHERCWYSASIRELDDVRAGLRSAGIDIAAAEKRGAVRFVTPDSFQLAHGRFDPERLIGVFNDLIEQALEDHFAGFRFAAEMTWVLEPAPGIDRVIEYEALLSPLFLSTGAMGLCLYHRDRIPPELLDGALTTHPVAALDTQEPGPNPFYRSTPIAELREPQSGDVAWKLRELRRRR
jgi:chemotaxis family two-component system sensor kinase Cph1